MTVNAWPDAGRTEMSPPARTATEGSCAFGRVGPVSNPRLIEIGSIHTHDGTTVRLQPKKSGRLEKLLFKT